MTDFQAEELKKYDMEQSQKDDTASCHLHHQAIRASLSSNDFPGHFTLRPPLCDELSLRFAFGEFVMQCEAGDAAMRPQ
jgi:hypothetical protein